MLISGPDCRKRTVRKGVCSVVIANRAKPINQCDPPLSLLPPPRHPFFRPSPTLSCPQQSLVVPTTPISGIAHWIYGLKEIAGGGGMWLPPQIMAGVKTELVVLKWDDLRRAHLFDLVVAVEKGCIV